MTRPPEELLTITIDLSGRRALVTGAGQGVGRGIAKTLGAAGAKVLVNDLVEERAASVVAEIETAGGAASTAIFDVTDWDAVNSSVEELGPVDLLVNNAGNAGKATTMGFDEMKAFAQEDPAAWEGFIKVNLLGRHVCHPRRAARDDRMRAQGASSRSSPTRRAPASCTWPLTRRQKPVLPG